MASQRRTLFLFTTSFPCKRHLAQYLFDEYQYLKEGFDKIYIFPSVYSESIEHPIDEGTEVVDLNKEAEERKHGWGDLLKAGMLLLSEWVKGKRFAYYSRNFLPLFKELVRTRLLAKELEAFMERRGLKKKEVTGYAYWFFDQALILAWAKRMNVLERTMARGHQADVYFKDRNLAGGPNLRSCFHRFKLRMMDRVCLINAHALNHLKRAFPSFRDRMATCYLGTKDHGMNPFVPLKDDEPLRIVTCSKMDRVLKRTHLIPEILKYVKRPVKWTHIRYFPQHEIDRIEEELKGCPHIESHFVGDLGRDDLFALYQRTPFHLFLNISSVEGLSVAMIEACSFGIPLMGTEVNGTPEVVTERSGELLPLEFNVEDVAQRIEAFATSSMNSEEFRKGVKAFWRERFDADRNYRSFVKELQDL